ncbi:two-component histidine kinase DevS [Mycobacteroides abscessus subsp. massiliense]|nr:two-component histidine kinase DevS [Mycobacteroides abscessus subsp. massiliense]
MTDETSFQVSVRISGPLDVVPTDIAEHARAVVREAVSNTVRHSQGSEVEILISVDDDLTIEITDNGVGIPHDAHRRGLRNLAARAKEVGGQVDISTPASGGTRIRWSAPLP